MQKWKQWPTRIIIVLLIVAPLYSSSQERVSNNLEFYVRLNKNRIKKQHKHRSYIFKKETSALKKYNPINITFGSLLFLYQNVLSPQFSADCLFHPTCSDFSKQAIQHFGLLKGIFLSADRITRCNRIAATSINPLKVEPESHHALDAVTLYQFKKRKSIEKVVCLKNQKVEESGKVKKVLKSLEKSR